MDVTVFIYTVYLIISIALTVWVARTLFINGQRFLADVFAGDHELALAVNHLLVVGFYLVIFAFVFLILPTSLEPRTARATVEALAHKIGTVLLILGGMHFF